MKYFFGIDGGGTTSRIQVITAEKHSIYINQGDSTNIYSGNMEAALQHLVFLINSTIKNLNLESSDFGGGCISSAGLSRPIEKSMIESYVRKHTRLTCPLYFCNDGESLLVGGLERTTGICLIAGTGSLAVGRLDNGILARSGGYGYMLGDEGSAFWIAHQAIIRTIRSIEQRDIHTNMLRDLLSYFNLNNHYDFIPLLHHDLDKSSIASAALIVTEHALAGDPLAICILDQAITELNNLIQSVITQLPELSSRAICLSGGVIEKDKYISGKIRDSIKTQFPSLIIEKKRNDAVYGACILALDNIEKK